jgi:hypothetical protein
MTAPPDLKLELLELVTLLQRYVRQPRPPVHDDEWQRLMTLSVLLLGKARGMLDLDDTLEALEHLPSDFVGLEALSERLRSRREQRHLPSRPKPGRRGVHL